MDFQLLLAVFASLIIIALAFYAGMLLNRIKRQKHQLEQAKAEQAQQVALKKQQRNDNICESIRFIARATAQKQCNVSEAAIRLSVLLETLLVEPKIDIDKRYPAISELFDKVKDFATHAERKSMDKKTLKQQDKQRHIFENDLEEAILKEAQSLENFSL
ncbi:DUF2489 domain-containing protein [Psychromonas sp. psych-6C06]|uniref:DUF2489 domain-containing protein n=1 Tax=Psychromonas sp. psych-6C06 TaxID=2058089 RepID=UPI000C3308C6|nr:DUF2489 domain-containing protein [Psychromonas sp. psych-6C06]PKF61522.1 DUF2489 domain-containing protein [Psychromonas sp. psych-6C06]